MAYPTRAALVAASDNVALLALTDAQADAKRRMAIINVERYTGQVFEPEAAATKVIDGSGGATLHLPKRLESITAISIRGTAYDLTDVVLAPEGDRLHIAALSTDYAVQAMREDGAIDSRTFRSGPGTVSITGTWGWTVTPDAVTEALRLEMEAEASAQASKLAPIIASARRLGVKTIAQGNLRAEIGDPSFVTPESAALLSGLLWLGPAGYIV